MNVLFGYRRTRTHINHTYSFCVHVCVCAFKSLNVITCPEMVLWTRKCMSAIVFKKLNIYNKESKSIIRCAHSSPTTTTLITLYPLIQAYPTAGVTHQSLWGCGCNSDIMRLQLQLSRYVVAIATQSLCGCGCMTYFIHLCNQFTTSHQIIS